MDLPEKLRRFEPLLRRAAQPILRLAAVVVQRAELKDGAIHPGR